MNPRREVSLEAFSLFVLHFSISSLFKDQKPNSKYFLSLFLPLLTCRCDNA